jgi:hypothetical protein
MSHSQAREAIRAQCPEIDPATVDQWALELVELWEAENNIENYESEE